ncbi:hypothetical protein NDI76_02145 [Halogeometricum sp. S1BR25-6]|uniref:PglZ domain-containing protein n=1 Tax=Halogeometricum salsisoli TaxID=2950536 RepID=A0ABU2G9P8_9EURY|nr:hypothetical protein [Halogeometricum sp. S1BR25-6]MDS0297542.1 hypothetical protein [Halogeometricum sp. S1BR25-6]
MTDGLYGQSEFDALLTEENIFDGVFECLRRIWGTENALGERELGGAEYRTRLLERELAKLYPPLYDELADQMGNHPITSLEDGCGVIMDALSLREGFRLERELADEHDWNVSLGWAPIERLPSETQFICREWFNAQSPSTVNRDDYRYIGDLDVPQLPGTSPEYVWTRHPDNRLEAALKGNYSTEEVENIYEDAKGLLEDIVHESVHTKFLVTSDHGYVNHLGASPYTLSDELKKSLKGKFSGRLAEVSNSQAFQILEQANIIERVSDHYVVRGHYKWTKPGDTKKIMHGGFSLPECMTPLLYVETNATGGN